MNELIENNPVAVLAQFNISYRIIGCVYCIVNSENTVIKRNVTKSQLSAIATQLVNASEQYNIG